MLGGKTCKRTVLLGSVEEIPSEKQAWKRAEWLRLSANADNPTRLPVSFAAVMDKYLAEELPEVRHSTGHSYRSYIENHIRPKWGEYNLNEIRPFAVEVWLKSIARAPKTKGAILNTMRLLFNCAMRWELIPLAVIP